MENNIKIDIDPYLYGNEGNEDVRKREKYVKFSPESNVQYYDPKKPILKSAQENIENDPPSCSLTNNDIMNCIFPFTMIIIFVAIISLFIFIFIITQKQ
jgi:hypothetical protein